MGLLQDLGQPADCPMYDGKGQFQLEDVKEKVEAFAAEVAARGQHKTEPVSYTHLDVYKRQAPSG